MLDKEYNDIHTILNLTHLKEHGGQFFGGYMVSHLCNIRAVRNIDVIINKSPVEFEQFNFNNFFSKPVLEKFVLNRPDIKIVKAQISPLNSNDFHVRFFWIENFPCLNNDADSLYMTPKQLAVSKYFAQGESPRNYFDFAKHLVDLSILYHTFGESVLLNALNELKDYYGRQSGIFPVNICKALNRFLANQQKAIQKMEALNIDNKYHSAILSGASGLSKMVQDFIDKEKNQGKSMGIDI